MKFPISTWIIIGLSIIIILLLLFRPSKPESPNIQPLRDSLAMKDQKIKLMEDDRGALFKEKESIIQESVQIQDSLRGRLNAKSNEVIRLKNNPIIIRVREEVPEVDSLIVAMDSVNFINEQRISVYEHQLNKLHVNMSAIIQNFEQNLALERGRYEDQKKISDTLAKDLKRQQRRGKLSKVLIPVVGIAGFLLGSQL